MHVFGSGRPVWFIVGGIHGNEPSGAETARRLAQHFAQNPPDCTVKIIPDANPEARGFRDNPIDNMNLNRCFPGDPGGTLSRRIAYHIWSESADADFILDLHDCSPGKAPYVLGILEGKSRILAENIDLPKKPSLGTRGQLFIEAMDRGQAAVIIEQPADGTTIDLCIRKIISAISGKKCCNMQPSANCIRLKDKENGEDSFPGAERGK